MASEGFDAFWELVDEFAVPGNRSKLVSDSRKRALAICRQAAQKTTHDQSDINRTIQKMISSLTTAKIFLIPKKNATEIFAEVGMKPLVALVPRGTKEIYLVEGFYTDREKIAQVLIHESTHLAGTLNEQDATILELFIMHSGGRGPSFHSGYVHKWPQCVDIVRKLLRKP